MLLIDHLFTQWMKLQAPGVQTLSYVDDWQTLTWDPDHAVRQLELVESFASMLDLTVDRKKTFAWSTDSNTRKDLRSSGLQVLHHARELGGHLGISRQYTNRTVAQRLQSLADFWPKLRSSRARHATKAHILRAVAWPRGLHAVASVPLGDNVWLDLRRRATQALGCQKPGINVGVLLGLVEALTDPQLVSLVWTCRTARQQCSVDFWETAVAPVSCGDLDLPPNSLASIVACRLRQVGLSVDRAGYVQDEFGRFHPHWTNYAEVELRLQWAWQRFVAHKVAHRPEFCGLWQVDVSATRRALATMDFADQAMYRHCLAGGLFTESYKSKWTQQSDACKWCGMPDTTHHRFWECPQHQDLRTTLASAAIPVLDDIPPRTQIEGLGFAALHLA